MAYIRRLLLFERGPCTVESLPPPAVARRIGVELYTACESNDVPQVQALTSSSSPPIRWTEVLAAAAIEGSTDVAAFCLAKGAKVNDYVLRQIACSDNSEPVYRYLVNTKAADVNHYIDRFGDMLGIAASSGRFSLVQFLLEHGASPDVRAELSGGLKPIACTARRGDEDMSRLLLDYGAQLKGTGALSFAAQEGNIAVADLLIARGAKVDETDIRIRGLDIEPRKWRTVYSKHSVHMTLTSPFCVQLFTTLLKLVMSKSLRSYY